jgi:hypothetical protein
MKHYSIEVCNEEDFTPDGGYEGIRLVLDAGGCELEARAALESYLDGLARRGFVVFQDYECAGEYRANRRSVWLRITVTSTVNLNVN